MQIARLPGSHEHAVGARLVALCHITRRIAAPDQVLPETRGGAPNPSILRVTCDSSVGALLPTSRETPAGRIRYNTR